MIDYDILEGNEETTEEEYFMEMQKAINGGVAWKFQGSYGRSMMDAIRSGYCMLGTESFSDYYGNKIPSRDEVEEGTRGSYDFVVDRMGADWADLMGGVQ
jgi:hypothetical protein